MVKLKKKKNTEKNKYKMYTKKDAFLLFKSTMYGICDSSSNVNWNHLF